MRWFEGDISQAVTQSRARNAVFVVFVQGKDEASQQIASAINDADVSAKLEGPNFVSIHFESGTQTFSQFSEIYRDPPVPSLYFIGRNGSPIGIVTQVSDSKSLLEKISYMENVHLDKSGGTQVASTKPVSKPEVASLSSSVTSAETNEGTGEVDTSEPGTSAVSLDDRVERAKELLEEKRMKKRAQEGEEARERELLRRKEGQSVQEFLRWQQEQEVKRFKEERLKEKRLEQEARQRVLEEIAQDRAARNAQSIALSTSSAPSKTTAPSTSRTSKISETRLQFRLPDGSTHLSRFDVNSTLADVREYLSSNVTLPYRDFALATAFPRREFSSQDNASTLCELQLIPSSVMLIIPAGGSSAVQPSGTGFFGLAQTLWIYLTYPITFLFSYIRFFVFGTPAPGSGANSSSSNSSGSTHTQSQPNPQHEKRQRRSGGAYRRSGNSNVHRLHQNHSSSDDENNTWNGNSTQQM